MKRTLCALVISFIFIKAFSQVNLNQGLVAYYPFNGNTLDVSGNNNNATNFGATLTTDQWGNPNSAYLFNGTSNYMSVASSPTLQMSSITLCAKVKPNAFYPGLCYNNSIFDRGNGGYGSGSFSLVYTPTLNQNPINYCYTPDTAFENYRINVHTSAPASLACITPVNAVPYVTTSQWDCVIGIFDNVTSTGSIYVNGVFRYSYSFPAGMGPVNNSNLYIGGTTNPTYPYYVNGILDELRIYNRALNAQEILALCNCNALQNNNALLNNDTTICGVANIPLLTDNTIDTNSIFWWSPTVALSDSASLNPIASPTVTTEYFFNLLMPGCNIIDNGDFESGNTGFTSQYNYTPVNITEGEYFVGSNPQAWNPGLGNFGDHTTGSGNMLLVNGAPIANTSVWCKTVAVTPNTDYAFSAWIQNVNTWGAASNPPVLQFSINGNLLGNPFTSTINAGVWEQFYQTWNSGANTSATICIVNQNVIAAGNDFAIDDISFAPYYIQQDSVTITIAAAPAILAGSDVTICNGQSTQLNASGGTSYVWAPAVGLNNPNISNPVSSATTTTTYTVTGTDAGGCSSTSSVTVTVNPLPIIIGTSNPPSFCPGSSVVLTGAGGSSYIWSGGVSDGVAFTPQSSGIYTVTGTDASGCTNTGTVSITALPDLTITIFPSAPVLCIGDSVQLQASGAISYVWSNTPGLNTYTGSSVWANPTISATYTVTGTDAGGCTGSTVAFVDVIMQIDVQVTKSKDAECGINVVQLAASGAQNYSWTPGALVSNPTAPVTNATAVQTTTFYVTGNTGSCTDMDSITVYYYNNDETGIIIPNAFSPNSDGLNDCIRVIHNANFKNFYFAVYNRWGQMVFETDSPDYCWDGNLNGKEAEIGTYFYYLKAETVCGQIFKKGDITLVR